MIPKRPRLESDNGVRLRVFGNVHRAAGLTAVLFLLLLAISGIAINHGDELRLDRRFVSAGWLLDWYGIETPRDVASVTTGGAWISQIGDRIFVNARELPGRYGELAGAVATPDAIAIGAGSAILLVAANGDVIEALGAEHGVPHDLRAIGIANGQVVVRGRHGTWTTDRDFGAWHEAPDIAAVWSSRAALPPDVQARVIEAWRGAGLPVSRVLADLHSGRMFGRIGVFFMDIVALVVVLLAASGIWLWWLRRRDNARKRAHVPRGRR
jgi:hypothetical protein